MSQNQEGVIKKWCQLYLKLRLRRDVHGGYGTHVSTFSAVVFILSGWAVICYGPETTLGLISALIWFLGIIIFGLDHYSATRRAKHKTSTGLIEWVLLIGVIAIFLSALLAAH